MHIDVGIFYLLGHLVPWSSHNVCYTLMKTAQAQQVTGREDEGRRRL